MKTSIKIILLGIISLTSCYTNGPLKNETGVVVAKQFKPSMDATGYGISTSGNVSMHTLSESEKFVVAFKCEHGVVFTVDNSNVFAKVNEGDTVKISYHELLSNERVDSPNTNGFKVVGFDFVDANKK